MIALYIRLSLADNDLDEVKEESNSVVNQRSLLHDFVKEHPEFSGEEVEEFRMTDTAEPILSARLFKE